MNLGCGIGNGGICGVNVAAGGIVYLVPAFSNLLLYLHFRFCCVSHFSAKLIRNYFETLNCLKNICQSLCKLFICVSISTFIAIISIVHTKYAPKHLWLCFLNFQCHVRIYCFLAHTHTHTHICTYVGIERPLWCCFAVCRLCVLAFIDPSYHCSRQSL